MNTSELWIDTYDVFAFSSKSLPLAEPLTHHAECCVSFSIHLETISEVFLLVSMLAHVSESHTVLSLRQFVRNGFCFPQTLLLRILPCLLDVFSRRGQCSAVYIALVEIGMARDIYIKHSCIARMELRPSSRHRR